MEPGISPQTPGGASPDYELLAPIGESQAAWVPALFFDAVEPRPHVRVTASVVGQGGWLYNGGFKPARDQRQSVNRFNRYILGEPYMKEAARLYPRSREETKKRDNEFCLTDRIHEAEYSHLKTPPEPAHKLVVTIEQDSFTEEKYRVYDNYQKVVHKEAPEDRTRRSFKRFLCNSPLRRQTVTDPDGRKRRLGSFHQCYRIDGNLVAIGVLDLLPDCVSSVYFLYHESIHKLTPGKIGALYEIALAMEEGYRWWYPGFYIHSCPKMRYKIDYTPQFILDPQTLTWDPLDDEVLGLLDRKSFVSLSLERQAASEGLQDPMNIDGGSGNTPVGSDQDDGGEDDDDEVNTSLFQSDMPGIPSLADMESVDLDHIPLKIFPSGPLFETSDLVSWDSKTVTDWPSAKASMAELAAALGPDLLGCGQRVQFRGNTFIMATQQTLLSPAELAYLHSSLSLRPPIRPDGRAPTQFRPLTAETGILPGTNGSARVCFSDGTEAIVGVKAEIERTAGAVRSEDLEGGEVQRGGADAEEERAKARGDWLEMTVEIPGQRDDDAATVFLAEMLREALLADEEFAKKLWINRRFHWRLYLDVLLISPPLSYPLPLLSLTTHLALLATRLPRLKSEGDEDPMFDDDWEASTFLYPREGGTAVSRPPITLLVVAVGDNIIFDPAKEELAVAESALAVSVSEVRGERKQGAMEVDSCRELRLLSMRTVDPPSRLTPPGVPNSANVATSGGSQPKQQQPKLDGRPEQGVWKAPLGGTKFAVLDSIIRAVLEKEGVAHEVLDGLDGVELA
ncbi:serine-rich protein [Purpureocillium lavendulum]|uniref:Serine-rich protein n=1 Tax=Purpureocillium lavendulum TaxID=1247861 RepID=A0AB34FRI8_9HYPO|nr:serine-rich protein [Purpureocillium lavendulum]